VWEVSGACVKVLHSLRVIDLTTTALNLKPCQPSAGKKHHVLETPREHFFFVTVPERDRG
jgi:hypothetical protein